MLCGLLTPIAAIADAVPNTKTVRLAVVNTPKFSGLIDALIKEFEVQSGYSVTVYSGSDVYDRARAGEADIVISHYGKAPVERFVLEGYGLWPRTVFSNQAAIIGPKSDPAQIRGMTSAAEAFAKIAKARAPFVANDLPGIRYLTDILWEEAGRRKSRLVSGTRRRQRTGRCRRRTAARVCDFRRLSFPFPIQEAAQQRHGTHGHLRSAVAAGDGVRRRQRR